MSGHDSKVRVLFIGIVQDGKVVQERPVPPGADVTVGPSPQASFVLPDLGLGDDAFPLFVHRDGRYHLRFTKKVKGKVKSEGQDVVLAEALPPGGEPGSVPLGEADKGKLRIGGVTVLFKFVEPQVAAAPAPAPASVEKLDFRPRLMQDEDDRVLAASLAFWAALGLVFGVWVSGAERIETGFDEIPDRFTRIVLEAPKPEERPPEEERKDDALAIEQETKQVTPEEKPPEPTTERERRVEEAKQIEQAKERLREESALFQAMQARMIGTTGENARGTVLHDNAAGNYEGISERLAQAEASGGPIGDGSRGRGKDGVPGGTGDRSIGGVQAGGDASGKAIDLGSAPTVAAPKGNVAASGLDFGGSESTNAEKVVRRYQGQLKYCYEHSLKTNPSLSGRVVVGWYVKDASASQVYIVENSTGDASLADCIVGKVKRWRFEGVDDGDAKSAFVFTPQE